MWVILFAALLFSSACSKLGNELKNIEDFILLDSEDKPFQFSKSIAEKHKTVIFFGYSHCPDICPNTLQRLTLILDKVQDLNNIQFLFITVDTKNDSRDRLVYFSQKFHPKIKLLRGNYNEIHKITKNFSVKNYRLKDDSIIHTTSVFFVNGTKLTDTLPDNLDLTELQAKIIDFAK